MGSSGGGDKYAIPQSPAPPASMITPQGMNTGYQPDYVNFLGDTNTPSTGLTPAMIAQIMGTGGGAGGPGNPGRSMGGGMGGGMPTQTPQAQQGPTAEQREGLARLMAGAPQKQARPGMGRGNAQYVGPGKAGPSYGQGNRSGWGGSSGGH